MCTCVYFHSSPAAPTSIYYEYLYQVVVKSTIPISAAAVFRSEGVPSNNRNIRLSIFMSQDEELRRISLMQIVIGIVGIGRGYRITRSSACSVNYISKQVYFYVCQTQVYILYGSQFLNITNLVLDYTIFKILQYLYVFTYVYKSVKQDTADLVFKTYSRHQSLT